MENGASDKVKMVAQLILKKAEKRDLGGVAGSLSSYSEPKTPIVFTVHNLGNIQNKTGIEDL